MELLMIYKISPHPSLSKRGREKVEMTHSITRRVKIIEEDLCERLSIRHGSKL
jgi:hypothetical protein